MSISSDNRKKWKTIPLEDQERIVRMAWEDRTTFESILIQFKLTANEVVKFMRTQLDEKAYKRWRQRATERGHLKHGTNVLGNEQRFKCSRQRIDGTTKGWK